MTRTAVAAALERARWLALQGAAGQAFAYNALDMLTRAMDYLEAQQRADPHPAACGCGGCVLVREWAG